MAVKFSFPRQDYHEQAYKNRLHTEAEYRAEYKRLYEVARKRLSRLKKAGFDEDKIYTYYKPRLQAISKLTPGELPKALSDMRKFLESERSTVSGTRKADQKALAALHRQGKYDFITEENLRSFGKFMEDFRDKEMEKVYGSEAAVLLFNAAEAQNLSINQIMDNYEEWLKNAELMDTLASDDDGYIDSDEWRRLVGSAKTRKTRTRKKKKGSK